MAEQPENSGDASESANDPCKSNDVDHWSLNQAMFDDRAKALGEDGDGNLLVNPCFVDREDTPAPSLAPTHRPTNDPTLRPTPPPTAAPVPQTAAPITPLPTAAWASLAPTLPPWTAPPTSALVTALPTAAWASLGPTWPPAEPSPAPTGGPPATEDATDSARGSLYGCAPSGVSGTGEAASGATGAAILTLTYDYDLYTSAPFDDGVLSSFETGMTRDLADQLGLLECDDGGRSGGAEGEPTRGRRGRGRQLRRRSLQPSGEVALVTALDSAPADESLAGSYECTGADDAAAICTPIRGYVTAYLAGDSSASAEGEAEAQLLALIQSGMQSDAFVGGSVVAAMYVGTRPEDVPQDNEQTIAGDDNSGVAPGDGDSNIADVNLSAIEGAQEAVVDPATPSQPLLAIGLVIVALAAVLALALGVYVRRRKRKQRCSDGPEGHGASLAALSPSPPTPRDPDDVHLLQSPERMDLRSIHSCDGSTDVETECYAYEGDDNRAREAASRYGDLYGGSFGDSGADVLTTLSAETDDRTPRCANGRVGGGSALAAMGTASTLAARSWASQPPDDQADPPGRSPPDSPADVSAAAGESRYSPYDSTSPSTYDDGGTESGTSFAMRDAESSLTDASPKSF